MLQVRAEALGALLAAAAFITPAIEQRLKELQPGRGRQAAASSVEGARSAFALLPTAPDLTKQVTPAPADPLPGLVDVVGGGLLQPAGACCVLRPAEVTLGCWEVPEQQQTAQPASPCPPQLISPSSPAAAPPLLLPPSLAVQELAWASYALLLNTNVCGLAVFWDGQAVLARGLLGAAALGPAAPAGSKSGAATVLVALSGDAASSRWKQGAAVYCQDRAAIGRAGAGDWTCVPAGVESLLLQPLLPFDAAGTASASSAAPRGFLMLLSERPRALSSKERAWAAAVGAKLHAALSG